jgi:SAM-dependent methyltransferase
MDPELYQRFFDIEDRYWWSVGTRRSFRGLIDRLGAAGGRVLDVGCGTGVMLRELPSGWRLAAGCDWSEAALAFCRQRGLQPLVRCDAVNLPFSDGVFRLVMALDVIEHLSDDRACVRELARVCGPGGYLLIHVPAFELLWSDKDEINRHYRRYGEPALRELVESAGLQVVHRRYLNTALMPIALLRSLWQRRIARRPPAEISAARLDHLYDLPRPINAALTALMDLERLIGTCWPAPFGMSLVCLARKPE